VREMRRDGVHIRLTILLARRPKRKAHKSRGTLNGCKKMIGGTAPNL
jgi:hypothetical protein